ncbi:MAG: hypothetical protein KDC27_18210, partial [Acidobacteria bacterium]|nr:hypothetical protein [Acidobacteriota bacterium]
MRQTLHIFKKDLRRGWPLLLVWAALLVWWIAPVWADPLSADVLPDADPLRGAIVILAGVILTALVIQQDGLVGAREFWMTRPIRRGSLLAAKAAFVGLFVAAPPLLLEYALLLRFGLPRALWPAQALELALPWVSVLALAALMASWTHGLPGFLAFYAALLLLPNFSSWIGAVTGSAFGVSDLYLPALGLLAVALLVVQYATRRRALGIAIGAPLACLVAVAVVRVAPGPVLSAAQPATLEPLRIQLRPGPGRSSFAVESVGATADRVMDVWFAPAAAAVPPGSTLELSRIEGEIHWDGGGASPFYAAGEWPLEASAARPPWRALGVQGDETFASLLGRSGRLEGRAVAGVWRIEATERLPLVPDAQARHQSTGVRVLGVDRAPGELRLRLRSREIVNLWRNTTRLQIALVNPLLGGRVPLEFDGEREDLRWQGLLVSRFVTAVAARQGLWRPRSEAGIDADWLAGAELELRFYDFAG